MVELSGPELTEHEAELYDRQIRLWGLESQKRLRASRILVAGLSGFGAEVAKNIILAGVKSVVLLDDSTVTEIEGCSQFLAPKLAIGSNRAEASLQRARALNPMVEIRADRRSANVSSDNYVGAEYFEEFDVVVLTGIPTSSLVAINEICRTKNIKFFAGDVWGMFGYTFADLQEHEFVEDVVKHKIISKPNEKQKTELITTTVKRSLNFPSFRALLDFDFKSPAFQKKIRRSGAAFIIMRILQEYRDRTGGDPCPGNRIEVYKELVRIRDNIAPGLVDERAFQHVFAQISPATAVVGGELAQEIIKTVSQREAPHHNLFLFDPETCCGFIESIEANEGVGGDKSNS